MIVRKTSALRAHIRHLFPVKNRESSLKMLSNLAGVSSPKAKVTRSNRVGCASLRFSGPPFSQKRKPPEVPPTGGTKVEITKNSAR